jgi:single-strand DNA-binding protein
MDLNKIMLIGNLGEDPKLTQVGESKICKFSLATKDYKGMVEWHKIVCFDKLAELVQPNCFKGQRVYIEGSLKTGKWTNADGTEGRRLEIIARDIIFLSGEKNGSTN